MSSKREFITRVIVRIVVVAAVVAVIAFVVMQLTQLGGVTKSKIVAMTEDQKCLPTFKDGGGPYYLPNQPFKYNIAPDEHNGDTLIVHGQLFDSTCETAIAGAVIDIWQASEEGSYDNEYYRGQIRTDDEGFYEFKTVVPKGYGEGTGYRPPHIHFKVHVDGEELVTSQMFFPEAQGRPGFNDEYIMTLESTERFGKVIHNGYHNIILP